MFRGVAICDSLKWQQFSWLACCLVATETTTINQISGCSRFRRLGILYRSKVQGMKRSILWFVSSPEDDQRRILLATLKHQWRWCLQIVTALLK